MPGLSAFPCRHGSAENSETFLCRFSKPHVFQNIRALMIFDVPVTNGACTRLTTSYKPL